MKMTNIKVSEDVYWYIRRYKVFKNHKTYDEVFRHWISLFDNRVPAENKLEKTFDKRGEISQDRTVSLSVSTKRWLLNYQVECRFLKIDDAVFNLIGWVQKCEGEW